MLRYDMRGLLILDQYTYHWNIEQFYINLYYML